MALQDILNLETGVVSSLAAVLGISLGILIALVFIWSIIWKGLALWKAARKNHTIWFIVFLIVNTVGILEILYIFWLSKIKLEKKVEVKARKKR